MQLGDQVHAWLQCYVCEWRLLNYLASFHVYVFMWCFCFLCFVVVTCFFIVWLVVLSCFLFLFSIQVYIAILLLYSSISHQLSFQQLNFLQSSPQILILLINNTLIIQNFLPILPLISLQPTTKITLICPHPRFFFL